MVLAQQPKRPTHPHQKKRVGQHQKHTKHYLKTYWPYLPVLALGAVTNVLLDHSLRGSELTSVASIHGSVTRLEWLTGTSSYVAALVAIATLLCAVIVATTHAHAWHRAVVRSEAFIIRNKRLDLALVVVATAGFILTRNVTGL